MCDTWRLMISQLPEVPSIAAMKTKYKDNHWGTSVKRLPWDNKTGQTSDYDMREDFIEVSTI